jgi:hypothetical protein
MLAAAQQKADPQPEPNPSEAAPEAPSRTLDIDHADAPFVLPIAMQQAATGYGASYQQIFTDILKVSFGPGKLTAEEYFNLRLFEDAALAGNDKRAFVGLSEMRKLWDVANYDLSWLGVLDDKVAFAAFFGGLGFPVIPTLALYAPASRRRHAGVLKTPEALERFLRDATNYPLFGKPTESLQSLGTASFESVDPTSGLLRSVSGQTIPVGAYVAEVSEHYAGGYLFQRRLPPHPAIRAICGERQATVRVVTIHGGSRPEILRACWKIPSVRNSADNFWRSGNMLARLDLETGRVLRAVEGVGLAQRQHETHPDTGAPLIGLTLPNWMQIRELTLDAHCAVGSMGLIGWDVATTDGGPVLVEANPNPDFMLPQIADARGILEPRFKAFLADRKQAASAAKRETRQQVMSNARQMRQRLVGSILK